MKTRRRNVSGDRLTATRRITRSMTSENGRENSSLGIPIDLIMEIFSRLPVKSIATCRCVSKVWASILRRPDFTELFLSRSWAHPKLLFACRKDGELFFFSSPQPQNPDENSSHVVANYQMKFSFECSSYQIVHGLVCLRDKRIKKEMVTVICNPSTGQAFPLPKVKTRRIGVKSLFGYDPIDKQFKVLSMTRPTRGRYDAMCAEHQVLTLGTGKPTWRMIQDCIRHYDPRKAICVNGVLYYTSIKKSTETYVIVCFDVRSEKFSFIKAKETLYRAMISGNMINCNGKLGLLLSKGDEAYVAVGGTSKRFMLWVLEDVEKQEWSEHEYLLPALWNDIVGHAILRIVGVTRTNEMVLSSCLPLFPYYLFYFNLERNTVVRVEIRGIDSSNYINSTFLDHVEDVKLM